MVYVGSGITFSVQNLQREFLHLSKSNSPNQVLTHAARAAARQLNFFSATSGGRARRARRALVRAKSLTGDARPRFFESLNRQNALLGEQVRRARSVDGRL